MDSLSKYGNIRHRGYASRKEANRAAELQALAKVGAITDLQEQVPFDLLPAAPKLGYRRPLIYIADFVFMENDVKKVVDVKGYRTAVYLVKKRLMLQLLGIEIEEM